MTLAQFKDSLKSDGAGPGAQWRRADFHVHMPASSDYEYKQADALEQLGRAISEADLAYAVILKHQEMPRREELAALQRYCPQTTLIPGAEVNVIVDTLFKKVSKDHFFHCIVAVDPSQGRDFGYVLEKAKEEFTYRSGEYPAGFRSSISDLGKFFLTQGALFIPAHLHQGKDPTSSRSIDDLYDDDAFLGFIRDKTFTAVEVRQLATARFFDGAHTTGDGVRIPMSVCVASSDAHHHSHIAARRRRTWVRTERRTYAELQAALSFPHRVALHEPDAHHARVIGLHVAGTFFPECWLQLNEGLNALIGSKGSGKTALLECLRFVLATPVPNDRREAVQRHLQHVLGAAGYVECLVQQADGTEALVTRRMDSANRLTILSADGSTQSVPSSDGPGFPVSILGWHEIEAVADQPTARIALLDRVDNPARVRRLSDEIARNIERARDLMPGLQRQIKKLDTALRILWDLKRKRRTLAKLEAGALSTLQSDYEQFLLAEQQLIRFQQNAATCVDTVPRRVQNDLKDEILAPRADGPAALALPALAALRRSIDEVSSLEAAVAAGLVSKLTTAGVAASVTAARLAELFAEFRDNVYTPQVNNLPVEEREILARQIQVLEETKQLPSAEAEVTDLLNGVRNVAAQVHAACETIRGLRNDIATHRANLVVRVNGELDGVRVTFLRSANQGARERFQSRHGAEGGGLLEYVTSFSGTESYDRLSALFASLRDIDVSEDKWQVRGIIYDVKAADLFDILDDDDISIELKVGTAGFVPIQRLSAGQRCVAVFPLLLRDTRGPLIIDQPEDNLDNRYIADTIAPDLLRKKGEQQFLVTSHNANVGVLTDADLIGHVDSNGATGRLAVVGFLSCGESPVKQAVLDVLDGGEAALGARRRKYGLAG